MLKKIGVLALLILVSSTFLISCSSNNSSKNSISKSTADPSKPHLEAKVDWQDWSDEVFARAKAENKFVILDLEAIWCHWCHVMDEKTYQDDVVVRLLEDNFIAVKVDQDSRPDLSNRYKEYGWPATIFFNSDGSEIAKRSGYIEPEKMADLLANIVKNPNPEELAEAKVEFVENAFLDEATLNKLEENFYNTYDSKEGGLTIFQKYIDMDTLEYALIRAREGNAEAKKIAVKTLNNSRKIIDPAWGGVYQYSTFGDWDHPHFEKLATVQGKYLRIYSLAYAALGDKKYLEASEDVYRYIKDFLTSPSGAFYTSQDADLVQGEHSDDYFKLGDKARRAQGIPRVDKNIYSYQNGLIIEALVAFYEATGKTKYLAGAERAADWIVNNRRLANGAFLHSPEDTDKGVGPYLNDNLNMAKALLALYEASAKREWLDLAVKTGSFMETNFKDAKAGILTVVSKAGALPKPVPLISENIEAARFFNLLHHYSGKESFKETAEHAMKYLATPAIALKSITEPGVMIADMELAKDPIHVTVVGSKRDGSAKKLYLKALTYPASYKRVEWWDKKEGRLYNHNVEYPELPQAAAFGCSQNRCSLPVYDPQDLITVLDS